MFRLGQTWPRSRSTSSCAADRRSASSTARRCRRIWPKRRRRPEMDTLALGDRDGVYGAPRFAAAARRVGIRPLVGADVTLADGPPLLLLVENKTGYKNLCRLLTRARAGLAKADPPRATPELLAEHAAGLIALGGAVPRADLRGSARRSGGRTSTWRCSATSTPAEAWNERAVTAQAAAAGVGLVATNDVRYATPRERLVHDVLTCAREKRTVDEIGRRLPAERRALAEVAARDRRAVRRPPRRRSGHARDRRALPVFSRRPRLHLPQVRRAGRRDGAELPREAVRGRCRPPLRRGRSAAPEGARAAGARAGDHRAARAGRLLPAGLGHRPGRASRRTS